MTYLSKYLVDLRERFIRDEVPRVHQLPLPLVGLDLLVHIQLLEGVQEVKRPIYSSYRGNRR